MKDEVKCFEKKGAKQERRAKFVIITMGEIVV